MKIQSKWVLWSLAGLLVVVLVVVNRSQQRDKAEDRPDQKGSTGDYTVGNLMDAGQAVETARRFVALWSMPEQGDDNASWEARLDPLVTDEIGRGLLVADMVYLPRLSLSEATLPDLRAISSVSTSVVVTLSDGSQIAVEVVPYGPGYAVGSFSGVDGE